MIVLGIDPGTWNVGWAVLDSRPGRVALVAFGCLSAPKKAKKIVERAAVICSGIEGVLERFSPECMALEEAFFGKNIQSALRIGEGRGFAIACAARKGIPVFEYSPVSVKKSAVGVGSAHKSQVQEMMRRHFSLEKLPEPEDAADAMAVAFCHCNQYGHEHPEILSGQG